MVVIVRQGKGQRIGWCPCRRALLQELRDYWRMHRPPVWLFPGECADGTLCPVTVQRQCQVAAQRAGLTKRCTPHTLRHSYATHLLEAGVDLITLQAILGHHDLRTTAHYVHVDARRLRGTPSLLDLLAVPQPLPGQPEGPA